MRVLDRKTARLCCLAADCDEPSYVKLVKVRGGAVHLGAFPPLTSLRSCPSPQAMCVQNNIPLMEVPAAVDLGKWVGLTKVKADGTPKKPVKCSCASVVDFGKDSTELTFLLKSLA